MNENEIPKQKGQSLIIVAAALAALIIFVALTVDLGSAYYHRRTAQNAADGAALAGGRELGSQLNRDVYSDHLIHLAVNDFAERNGIDDTDGILANEFNDNVVAYYLYGNGERITYPDSTVYMTVGNGTVPAAANGIEAVTYMTAPTYFGGILGYDGYRVSAEAAVVYGNACGVGCVVPIATHEDSLELVEEAEWLDREPCFNIWNGEGPGNFGWLNWSFQVAHWAESGATQGPEDCKTDDCSSVCLANNLDPSEECRSGFIMVTDWVAGTTGVSNDSKVRRHLETYIGDPDWYHGGYEDGVTDTNRIPIPFTVVIWGPGENQWVDTEPPTIPEPGVITDGSGCGDTAQDGSAKGLHYNVVGFGEMQLLGYKLSQGQSYDPVISPSECITLGAWQDIDPNQGNRLTAVYMGRNEGQAGTCTTKGTVDGLSLFK